MWDLSPDGSGSTVDYRGQVTIKGLFTPVVTLIVYSQFVEIDAETKRDVRSGIR